MWVTRKPVPTQWNRLSSSRFYSAFSEKACYENSLGKVKMMMKKNTFYQFSPEFQKIQADVEKYLSEEWRTKGEEFMCNAYWILHSFAISISYPLYHCHRTIVSALFQSFLGSEFLQEKGHSLFVLWICRIQYQPFPLPTLQISYLHG